MAEQALNSPRGRGIHHSGFSKQVDGQQLVKGRAKKIKEQVPLARSDSFDADLYTGHVGPLLASEVSGPLVFCAF